MKDIEEFIQAARQHGEIDDPDQEVGDLQELLRAAWYILSPAQRVSLTTSETVIALRSINDFEEEVA